MRNNDIQLIDRLLTDLQQETDRGLALVAASFLDERLKLMLAAYFQGEKTQLERDLLRFDRPLGEAKARLSLCFALGLVNERERRQIGLLFEIRNQFGHKVLTQSFDGHKDDTTVPDKIALLEPDLPEGVVPGRRARVVFSVVEMWVQLWYRHEWIEKLRPVLPLWEVIASAQKSQDQRP